jgi:hypothetical protein
MAHNTFFFQNEVLAFATTPLLKSSKIRNNQKWLESGFFYRQSICVEIVGTFHSVNLI